MTIPVLKRPKKDKNFPTCWGGGAWPSAPQLHQDPSFYEAVPTDPKYKPYQEILWWDSLFECAHILCVCTFMLIKPLCFPESVLTLNSFLHGDKNLVLLLGWGLLWPLIACDITMREGVKWYISMSLSMSISLFICISMWCRNRTT